LTDKPLSNNINIKPALNK